MIIQNSQPTPFSGRAKVIKDADKICRDINNAFPHFTPSYSWINFGKPKAFNPLFKRCEHKLEFIREKMLHTDYAYDFYDVLMRLVRELKCANCGELSSIAYITCQNKKLKNVNMLALYGYNPKTRRLVDFDHSVVSFEHGKDTVIIDPWLGIADFSKNYLQTCANRYHKFFKKFKPKLQMVTRPDDVVRIHPDDVKDLMRHYPELCE